MLVVSKKTKVRHRNGINKTLIQMPLSARRLLFIIMAQIDTMKIIPSGKVFTVSAAVYSDLCGIDKGTAYAQLKDGAKALHTQSLEVSQDDLLKAFARRPSECFKNESEWKGMRMLHITDSCSYADDEGTVQVQFSRQMEPYICMLEKDFTTQVLMSNIRLSDSNSAKLYQLLRANISKGNTHYFISSVDDVKKALLIDDVETYKEYKFFKSQFINRSVKKLIEVTEFTNITMEIEARKGRRVQTVKFSYEYEKI